MKKFLIIFSIVIIGLLCIRSTELHNLIQFVSSDVTLERESNRVPDNNKSSRVSSTTTIEPLVLNEKKSNLYISLYADSAILINYNTGDILYKKNERDKMYPASTTKLITALTALDFCSIDDKVTVGREVYFPKAGSSLANLKQGQILTMKMLLEGLLIPSGNDSAYVIAVYTARKVTGDESMSEENAVNYFIDLMNQKVKELHLKDTVFKNPDGFDENGQYTTAYDMAVIARNALNNEIIQEIASKSVVKNILLSGEEITWTTSNELIKRDSIYYYKYAIGLKTGTSEKAGSCLISAAKEGDVEVLSVVLNSTPKGRWSDSLKMLEYGIEELLR